jgi:MoaA/NifB/PqqE/SkfB family radical SAM enzyme
VKANQKHQIQTIQLETTTRCNLTCITCLKDAYRNSWREKDMDRELFNCILAQIKDVKPVVHLQGWGEPLLHPETLAHVKQLKAIDSVVSFTTNGTVMDNSIAESLIESGLDGLTFSMAGITRHSQNHLRGPETLAQLKDGIRRIVSARKSIQSQNLRLAVSYLLTPETVPELPKAVSWCRKSDIDRFVTVHLTQAGCRVQQELQYMKEKNDETLTDHLLRIRAHGAALLGKIILQLRPFHSTLTPVCDKNPLNSLFISVDGDISPCVFLCPPVEQGITWYHRGGKRKQKPLIFGNIMDSSLTEIWESPAYRQFRGKFLIRREFHERKLSKVSYSLSGSAALDNAVKAINYYFQANPPPGECLACAKLDGY